MSPAEHQLLTLTQQLKQMRAEIENLRKSNAAIKKRLREVETSMRQLTERMA